MGADTLLRYVSPYFRKETIASTWQYEVRGYRFAGTFTETSDTVTYKPDPRTARIKRGRRQTRRIRNDIDESELGPRPKRCSACKQCGHTYRQCPGNEAGPSSVEAAPAGDVTDGRAPVASRSGRRRSTSSATTTGYIV